MMKGRWESFEFDAPVEGSDKYGVTQTGFTTEPVYACKGQVQYLRGGEDVMSARLDGRQPMIVRIRVTVTSQTITTKYRMRDTRRNDYYNIRGITPVDDGRHLDLLCEKGVAI